RPAGAANDPGAASLELPQSGALFTRPGGPALFYLDAEPSPLAHRRLPDHAARDRRSDAAAAGSAPRWASDRRAARGPPRPASDLAAPPDPGGGAAVGAGVL